jgi:5-methylthioadenosine/S-adenosylhomocysteine deaminase
LPARQAVATATIGGARALHMADRIGSLEPGKEADVIVVRMDPVHNRPHFHNHDEAIYSRLIYAAKAPDVAHVICNGRWLMRNRKLLTIDEKATLAAAAQVASKIDAFVLERESSPYNKLVILAGVERQESFEVQVKAPIADVAPIRRQLEEGTIEVTRRSHYQQYDTYFFFSGDDPDAARLRYREDEFIDEETGVSQVRARLTLIGEEERQQFPNAVMLSRSRFLAAADRTLRFYREYFNPEREVEVVKERQRWHILYHGTDFAVNLDQVQQPDFPGHFLEIKSRTWSRTDAERKARLITELLELFGVDPEQAEPKDYPELAETGVS